MSGRAWIWPQMGLRLREQRLAKGMSAKAVAAALGVGYQAVWKLEHGLTVPSAWQVRQLCILWGVSADALLGIGQEEVMTSAGGCPKQPAGRARIATPNSSSRKTNPGRERTTK